MPVPPLAARAACSKVAVCSARRGGRDHWMRCSALSVVLRVRTAQAESGSPRFRPGEARCVQDQVAGELQNEDSLMRSTRRSSFAHGHGERRGETNHLMRVCNRPDGTASLDPHHARLPLPLCSALASGPGPSAPAGPWRPCGLCDCFFDLASSEREPLDCSALPSKPRPGAASRKPRATAAHRLRRRPRHPSVSAHVSGIAGRTAIKCSCRLRTPIRPARP